MKNTISEKQWSWAAQELGVELAAIKAVAKVESKGDAFLKTGEPKILFEPHVFWRELSKKGLDPEKIVKEHNCGDILYENWKTGSYGRYSQQHGKLERACKIDREAALKSCSWGEFQIMGFNYANSGYDTLQDFINDMYESRFSHLKAFVGLINKQIGMKVALKRKDWPQFAELYNGKGYRRNNYHNKMRAAYDYFK